MKKKGIGVLVKNGKGHRRSGRVRVCMVTLCKMKREVSVHESGKNKEKRKKEMKCVSS